MPALHVDRQTPVNAGYLNQHPYIASAALGSIIICAGRIRYNGSSWEATSGWFASGIVTGNLTWGSPSASLLNISVSGLTSSPTVIVTPMGNSSYIPFVASGSTSTNIVVGFRDYAGTQITTQDTSMHFSIFIIGV